jgi:hypothetical protein
MSNSESGENTVSGTASRTARRTRDPEKPVVGLLANRYAEWYMGFQPIGNAARTELAEVFVEKARDAARRYVEMERVSRPACWNDWTRDPESRHWMHKHFDERQAWARSIELLWEFSDGEEVDADALREALVRHSLRFHRQGRRGRNEEHVLVKAAGIVRDTAGLDRMSDARREAIHSDYQ